MRQSKCVHYEAPFMFLFVGSNAALLVDTGATEDPTTFPLYDTVAYILDNYDRQSEVDRELIVAHTHGHHDHLAADSQFIGKPRTIVVGKRVEDIRLYFGIRDWPSEHALIDLGGRQIEILPIPGHQEASLAFYDRTTRILLTGDTFYPGRLYVDDWAAFKVSIKKLGDFAESHPVDYILGNHIEMSTTEGKDYPTGATFQPEEHRLPLTIEDLRSLNMALRNIGHAPAREVHPNFIISPK